MKLRSIALIGATIAILLFVLSPVTLSYVTTDSMDPTISPGDTYLVTPETTYETGDVITFYADKTDQYITHRIVEETEEGYITKGDNNGRTDQEAAVSSPVTNDVIIGSAFTINNTIITIPNTASLLQTINQHRLVFLTLLGFLAALLLTSDSQHQTTISSQELFAMITITTILFFTLLILITGITQPLTFVASEASPNTGSSIPLNQEITRTIYTNTQFYPAYTLATSEQATVVSHTQLNNSIATTLSFGPYNTIGSKQVDIEVYQYPQTLPKPLVVTLHTIHPILAAFATALTPTLPIIIPLYYGAFSATPLRLTPLTRYLPKR